MSSALNNLFRITLLCVLSSTAFANDQFWRPLNSSALVHAQQAGDDSSDMVASLVSSNYLDLDGRVSAKNEFSVTRQFNTESAFNFQYADSYKQRNFVMGLTHKNLSVSMLSGSGEDYSRLAGQYTGVDPYLFHGGSRHQFDVSGYALDYSIGRFGHVQYGQAKVEAAGLQTRRGRYFEWSSNNLFARASQFLRDSDEVGRGLDLGYAFGNKSVAVQAMRLENDKSMQRVRFQLNGKQTRQYWLDLSAHQNPLFEANDDYRVMFNFATLFGKSRFANYSGYQSDDVVADSEEASKTKKKGKGWKRAVFIGGGIAAAAALSSSGDEKNDSASRFKTQNDAARDILNRINPTSIRENKEYGGWVYLGVDGSYASTAPVSGDNDSVTLPDPGLVIPAGGTLTASYHTHAAFDPRYDNENFSSTDLESDRAVGVDGYLGTPLGQFKYHELKTGKIYVLGTIATN